MLESNDMAKGFNNRPIVMCEPNHDGIYSSSESYVSLNSESVLLSALKEAEDGGCDIIRIAETAGRKQDVVIKYFDEKYSVSVNPYEIKTLKLDDGKATEVNITED